MDVFLMDGMVAHLSQCAGQVNIALSEELHWPQSPREFLVRLNSDLLFEESVFDLLALMEKSNLIRPQVLVAEWIGIFYVWA